MWVRERFIFGAFLVEQPSISLCFTFYFIYSTFHMMAGFPHKEDVMTVSLVMVYFVDYSLHYGLCVGYVLVHC